MAQSGRHTPPKTPHPDTLAVHAGQSPDPTTGANRYVCRTHVDPAREHLRQLNSPGGVNVVPFGDQQEAA